MDKIKSVKEYAREAKQRLKSGFWENYHKNLEQEIEKAKVAGVSESKVVEYYTTKVTENIRNKEVEDQEFYFKVKKLLDEEGEVSGALGRLTDHEIYDNLSYEEKQRYNLSLSEKYLKAVERYHKEKSMQF